MANHVAVTRNGRFVVTRRGEQLEITDVIGTEPRRTIDAQGAFACVGGELWVAGTTLRRVPLAGASRGTGRESVLAAAATAITPFASGAVIDGAVPMLVEHDVEFVLAADRRWLPLHGRRLLACGDRNGDRRTEIHTLGQDGSFAAPVRGRVLAAAAVFSGRALVIAAESEIVLCTPTGLVVRRIEVPGSYACAIADDAAIAIVLGGDRTLAIDLRHGQVRASVPFADDIAELAIDASARRMAIARANGEVALVTYDAMFPRTTLPVIASTTRATIPPPEIAPVDGDIETSARRHGPGPIATPTVVAVVADDDAATDEPRPLALASRARKADLAVVPTGGKPFAHPDEHVAALVELMTARTALAIAEAWHSGTLSFDVEGGLPFEHEVLGLVGDGIGLAPDSVRRARVRLGERATEIRDRVLASLASGMTLPFVELAREYELSPLATQILVAALAPRLRGEVGRLYGILGGITGRVACDIELAQHLIADDVSGRIAVASELAGNGVLVRSGIVRLETAAGARTDSRIGVVVDDLLVDRLLGRAPATELSAATRRRTADRSVAQVVVPNSVVRELRATLREVDAATPARLVVRGRRGSGRHTLIAALAAEVDMAIAEVDVSRLPRGAGLGIALAVELSRAMLAHAVPMLSGLEAFDDDDARQAIRVAIERHLGPIAIRTGLYDELALGPDHVAVTLPALSIGDRVVGWRVALHNHGLTVAAADTDAFAMRYRFGPGTIDRVCAVAARRNRSPDREQDHARIVDGCARQYVASRLSRIATRVERLPDWDQVTLPGDMRDSVRELIGRSRHQRTVYEQWGFDRRITTARGIAALFYGPPGTGKTLVAGLVARELGLEMWRVDLAKVMSKWLGETEKNLGELFDAADEGQVMLLFDEADSLFTKRTEVKSSNDRYANLEVNYLLQRLDSFEGIAILTTNLEKSIDAAFKRRMSMRLYFPFPDEDLRAELWANHVPPEAPSGGAFNFAELARRYPLSGGYIRNSALRAAFLAAQEQRPLCQDHLVRAVELEYREVGNLATSGRME